MGTFVVADILIVVIATVLAFFARFEGAIPVDFLRIIAPTAVAASILFPLLFLTFGLYGYIWRYVGVPALVRVGWVTALGIGLMAVMDILLTGPPLGRPIPFGTLLIFGVLVFVGFFGVRIFGRLIAYVQSSQPIAGSRRVLVVGAGRAGSLLIRDVESNRDHGLRIVGLVDDEPSKQRLTIGKARVVGTTDQLPRLAAEYEADAVFVALPGSPDHEIRRILGLCGQTGLPVKLIPSLASTRSSIGLVDLKEVRPEDLLGRELVSIDLSQIRERIRGKRVLVTGAAGSIGAELCRQIAPLEPDRLLMVEMDESRLYETYLEVREICGSAAWMSLTDIRSKRKLEGVFASEKPDLVIHAAAYKHVPLMEYEPAEAVKANVLGTLNVLQCCGEHGVVDFTLISTDKAVSPKSVMGATKRIAERLSLAQARHGTRVTIVRFGNVLGSRGSVLPLFKQAMQRGESIHITHPDVTRYFMSIPEAVQLVLMAGSMTEGSDLFVLDMGDPVRVLDLAHELIQMAGGSADLDFSGLRPAEKLHEILVTAEEDLVSTDVEKILKLAALPVNPEDFDQAVESCIRLALTEGSTPDQIRETISTLLSEYSSDGSSPVD